MNLYVALLRLIARASAALTLACGAAVVVPLRALGRWIAAPATLSGPVLAVRTDRRLTAAELEVALQLPTELRPLDQRTPARHRADPAWPPRLPITRVTRFGPRTDAEIVADVERQARELADDLVERFGRDGAAYLIGKELR